MIRLASVPLIASFLFLYANSMIASGGQFPPHGSDERLPADIANKIVAPAVLVLTPEFCGTKKRLSWAIRDVLHLGEATCRRVPESLRNVFADLEVAESMPPPGGVAQRMVLVPSFAEMSTTRPMLPSSQKKLVVLLEWNVRNSAGQTIWLQTIEGTSERKAGWLITKKGMDALVDGAVQKIAAESARQMERAHELQQ